MKTGLSLFDATQNRARSADRMLRKCIAAGFALGIIALVLLKTLSYHEPGSAAAPASLPALPAVTMR
ncbi:MAG TPA: hypothetical protein VG733_08645 [Chthoniobacteraceae bacterium]|nr:hypothetical protein [Chthoniobacteraceae bacterium]